MTSAPVSDLCQSGSPTTVTTNLSAFDWSCLGSGGGSTAVCSAARGYTVTASAGVNGTISPSSQVISYNSIASFTVTQATGYTAMVAGCGGSLSGNTYTTGPITADCSISASFTPSATYPLTLLKAGTGDGVVSGGGNYPTNALVTLTATPDPDATFSGWSPAPCAASFAMPAQALTCTAAFTRTGYTVTPSAGPHGQLSPGTPQSVAAGQTATFTVLPETRYAAAVVGCAGTLTGNQYRTGPINSDCTVSATFSQNRYQVDTNAGLHGTISPSAQTIAHGGTASFTVLPDAGYTAAVIGCEGVLTGDRYTTGPIINDCIVSATFSQEQYAVNVSVGANGAISPAAKTVAYGQRADFTVIRDTGYTAVVIGCNGTLSGTRYLTGPILADCTVSATFSRDRYVINAEANAQGTIEPATQTRPYGGTADFTITPDVGYTAAVTGCEGILTGDLYTTDPILKPCTVRATFGQGQYLVSTDAGPNGAIDPIEKTISYGGTAEFIITPEAGYTAAVIGCEGVLTGDLYTTGPIIDDCTVSTTFSQKSYPVSASAGANGAIDPAEHTIAHGGTADFTVIGDTGYRSAVTGCSGKLRGELYTTGPIVKDCTVNATFGAILYTLLVTRQGGGTVASAPAGIDCGADCREDYLQGTSVTLTATPDPDALFTVWSGVCVGVNPVCTVAMNAAKSVSATFEPINALMRLTTATMGSGSGRITSTPAGIDCGSKCHQDYTSATQVTLTAQADAGSTFGGWLGTCSGQGACEVTVDRARSVTATFNPLN